MSASNGERGTGNGEQGIRVRFAPSPTGKFHVGGARTALFNWLFARHEKGRFILRIEDTDFTRNTEDSLREILESLEWLGLDWDEGPGASREWSVERGEPLRPPEGAGVPAASPPQGYGPYFQSHRLHLYERTKNELLNTDYAYHCFCSKEELDQMRDEALKRGEPPRYDGRCRSLSPNEVERRKEEGQPFVIRFRQPDVAHSVALKDLIRGPVAFETDDLDDFVLVKSSGWPVYNFAAVVDDHEMAITHVLRGEEHLSNTPRQLLVYEALGWEPPQFAHLPILLNTKRQKLSKRELAEGMLGFREEGYLPEAIVNFLALLGWSPGSDREIFSREELIQQFDLERVNPAAAVFDQKKMEWMNAEYLKQLPTPELLKQARPFFQKAGLLPEGPLSAEQESYWRQVVDLIKGSEEHILTGYTETVIDLMKQRARTLKQLAEYSTYFFREDYPMDPEAVRKRLELPAGMGRLLGGVAAALERVEPWDQPSIEQTLRAGVEADGGDARAAIHAARVALTGYAVGPSLFALMEVLGWERCVQRLKRVGAQLQTGGLTSEETGETRHWKG